MHTLYVHGMHEVPTEDANLTDASGVRELIWHF